MIDTERELHYARCPICKFTCFSDNIQKFGIRLKKGRGYKSAPLVHFRCSCKTEWYMSADHAHKEVVENV